MFEAKIQEVIFLFYFALKNIVKIVYWTESVCEKWQPTEIQGTEDHPSP